MSYKKNSTTVIQLLYNYFDRLLEQFLPLKIVHFLLELMFSTMSQNFIYKPGEINLVFIIYRDINFVKINLKIIYTICGREGLPLKTFLVQGT